MKVLLINPPSERIVEPWDKPDFPHLGLAYLSAFIRGKGVTVSAIDAKFERLNIDQVVDRARSFSSDIIGITAMTNYIKAAAFLAKKLKEIFPNTIFLIGGAHPTALPVETLEEFPIFDIAVAGEGEEVLYEIIKSNPSQWPLIEGISYRKDGKVIKNNLRNKIKPLDCLPFPAWDMFPSADIYPLITSRGCPFKCIFCMRMHGEDVRLRHPDNVLQEIEVLVKKYNIHHIPIIDEIFTINEERVREICNLLVQTGLNSRVTWGVNSRVRGVSLGMFKKMYEAGCRKIDFGIESGNDNILKRIKKRTTKEDAAMAVKWAKSAHIKTHGLFIIGHPYETTETINDTIKFAIKLNTTFLSVGIMVPYPGTEIYDMAKRGLGGCKLISNDWNDYNKQIGHALELDGLSRKKLESFQAKAYLKFYLYNFRIIALMIFLFSYRRAIFYFLKNKILQK